VEGLAVILNADVVCDAVISTGLRLVRAARAAGAGGRRHGRVYGDDASAKSTAQWVLSSLFALAGLLLRSRLLFFPLLVQVGFLWPQVLPAKARARWRHVIDGRESPLGAHAYKLVQALCALLLLPGSFKAGRSPSWATLLACAVVAVGTGAVLRIWSNVTNSIGNHAGVQGMVRQQRQRQENGDGKLYILTMAGVNAFCEEAVYRCLFLYGLQLGGWAAPAANVIQALQFGIAHFYGVPSGWSGVALSAIYGLILGYITVAFDGVGVVLLLHTSADYIIFTEIVKP